MTPEGLQRLILDEGSEAYLYDDATGRRVGQLPSGGNATIGVGRNLSVNPLSQDEISFLLNNDIDVRTLEIGKILPWVQSVDPVRLDVIVMVEFNTGDVFQFRQMLAAIQDKNWELAAVQLMDSDAARKLPDRYNRMKQALISGTWAI